MNTPLARLLIAAATIGYYFEVSYEGCVDYMGDSVELALDALEACDEMELHIRDANGKVIGWAFIVNGNDEDEQISDCSGLVSDWLDENEG
jgi:hypothetical protein